METYIERVKWQVSLSNGETLYEGKGQFQRIKGEKSPWQLLLSYMALKEVYITSMSLYTDDGQRFNLAEKPLDYVFFRQMIQDHEGTIDETGVANIEKTTVADLCTVIEAIYKDYRLQLWVSEIDPRICWTVVVPHGV
jgi:hypothetical protein